MYQLAADNSVARLNCLLSRRDAKPRIARKNVSRANADASPRARVIERNIPPMRLSLRKYINVT